MLAVSDSTSASQTCWALLAHATYHTCCCTACSALLNLTCLHLLLLGYSLAREHAQSWTANSSDGEEEESEKDEEEQDREEQEEDDEEEKDEAEYEESEESEDGQEEEVNREQNKRS